MNHPSQPEKPSDQVAYGNSNAVTGNRRRTIAISALAVFITVLIFAALYGWRLWRQAGSGPSPWPAVAVTAMQLAPTEVPASIETIGSLRAVREVSLAPETAGRVVSIGFETSEQVKAGSLLVQLYDAPERADLGAAKARADLADAQLARANRLISSGAESRETLDQRIAERDQALAAVRQLEARIEQKQIRAPFAGQLGIRRIDLGQYLNPGDVIATLTDTRQLYVDFNVPQQQLRWLETGRTVRITSDTWAEREFVATVDAIEPRISADTRNVEVRALLSNDGNALRPGMFVNAKLELPTEPNRLVVPATAIQTTAAGDSVLVVRGPEATTHGNVEYVRVTTGRRLGNRVIVNDGLEAGDIIITEGQLRVPPGAQVQVTNLQAPATEAQ